MKHKRTHAGTCGGFNGRGSSENAGNGKKAQETDANDLSDLPRAGKKQDFCDLNTEKNVTIFGDGIIQLNY